MKSMLDKAGCRSTGAESTLLLFEHCTATTQHCGLCRPLTCVWTGWRRTRPSGWWTSHTSHTTVRCGPTGVRPSALVGWGHAPRRLACRRPRAHTHTHARSVVRLLTFHTPYAPVRLAAWIPTPSACGFAASGTRHTARRKGWVSGLNDGCGCGGQCRYAPLPQERLSRGSALS